MVRLIIGIYLVVQGVILLITAIVSSEPAAEKLLGIILAFPMMIGGGGLIYIGKRFIKRRRMVIENALKMLQESDEVNAVELAGSFGLSEIQIRKFLSYGRKKGILPDFDREIIEDQTGEILTVEDILKMSQSGLSENTIIDKIHASGFIGLSVDDINKLKNSGMSETIIQESIKIGETPREQQLRTELGPIELNKKRDIYKIDQFKKNLDSNYWKDVQKASYMEVKFDITVSSKVRLGKQRLLIKHYPILDEDTLSVLVKDYWEINKQPRRMVGANIFIFCIIADKISENAINMLSTFPFKNFSKTFSTGERGVPLIVDIESKLIYGSKCPKFPKPVRQRYESVLECIRNTYQISEIRKSPNPEVTYEKMKSELKKWGYGLMGFGALHIVLASVLDPVWGVILIIVGICNILISHRALFIVNGIAIMTAAVFNMIAMAEAGAGALIILIIMQIGWGINEIRKFKLYDEVKWPNNYREETGKSAKLPEDFECPNCGEELELEKQEQEEKKFTCPSCKKFIDMS